ncbi:MAG: hypothetical protein Q9M91_01605 [Candidatus Dojkabacteria bacterium]|nr:hypothetical protein [Candidatus Dojkabacteria bacterium]MDQ7020521.1 hypothetical protein [Candidatus Dojkabacteria bacterium]
MDQLDRSLQEEIQEKTELARDVRKNARSIAVEYGGNQLDVINSAIPAYLDNQIVQGERLLTLVRFEEQGIDVLIHPTVNTRSYSKGSFEIHFLTTEGYRYLANSNAGCLNLLKNAKEGRTQEAMMKAFSMENEGNLTMKELEPIMNFIIKVTEYINETYSAPVVILVPDSTEYWNKRRNLYKKMEMRFVPKNHYLYVINQYNHLNVDSVIVVDGLRYTYNVDTDSLYILDDDDSKTLVMQNNQLSG